MNTIATKKWKHAHHNAEVVSVLEQVLKYPDDPESAVDYLLSRLTGHPDAAKMFSDRQLAKLRRVLEHHAGKYQDAIRAIYERFDTEIQATCPKAADFAPLFLKDAEAARKLATRCGKCP
jgi:hypothetical protein